MIKNKKELLEVAKSMINNIDYDKIVAIQVSETPAEMMGTNVVISLTINNDNEPAGYYLAEEEEEEKGFMI